MSEKAIYKEALFNNKTGELRVSFDTVNPEVVIVVKLYGDAGEMATLKMFRASYEQVKAHWRTTTPHKLTATEQSEVARVIAELLPSYEIIGL